MLIIIKQQGTSHEISIRYVDILFSYHTELYDLYDKDKIKVEKISVQYRSNSLKQWILRNKKIILKTANFCIVKREKSSF